MLNKYIYSYIKSTIACYNIRTLDFLGRGATGGGRMTGISLVLVEFLILSIL